MLTIKDGLLGIRISLPIADSPSAQNIEIHLNPWRGSGQSVKLAPKVAWAAYLHAELRFHIGS